MNKTAVVRQR